MINAIMNFHAVGQGCFYTGMITGSGLPQHFNFVYDCGTVSNPKDLDLAIKEFKSKLVDKTIDLCVISHFDQDHINGITKLLEGITCKRLVMPYYEPVERLALLMNAKKITQTYKNILEDPTRYFSRKKFNIWEVVLIDGSGGVSTQKGFPEPPTPNDDNSVSQESESRGGNVSDSGFRDDWQDTPVNEARIKEIAENEPLFVNNGKVKLMQMPYRMKTDFYQFIFYCRKFGEKRYLERRKNIAEITSKVDKCFRGLKIKHPGIVRNLTDLFRNDMVSELRKLYTNVFGENLNVTSLVMFHQPLQPQKYIFHDRFFMVDHRYDISRPYPNATLLTGDIDIESKKKLEEIVDYFKHYLNQVIVFQVPHHGSKHNWPLKVSPRLLPVFPIYVINHGIGRVKHPSREVTDNIRSIAAKYCIVLNNETTEYRYCYRFF